MAEAEEKMSTSAQTNQDAADDDEDEKVEDE